MRRVCPKCGAEKEYSEFVKCNRNKSGIKSYCKECQRAYLQKWNKENRQKINEYLRFKREENPEKFKEKVKEWRANHPEKCREWQREWRKNNPEKAREAGRRGAAARRNNPKYRLSNSMSSGILQSIKQGTKANRRWESLVDFTISQLRVHLEQLFKPGWTWENYGTVWHIDHKTPIAVFNFNKPEDIDFRICWSLKNLQPMDAMENKIKKAKIDKPFQPSLAIGG